MKTGGAALEGRRVELGGWGLMRAKRMVVGEELVSGSALVEELAN
jgi:hypothetical protein